MELALILAIGTLIAEYGIPAALDIIKAWQVEGEPTAADIAALKDMKPPGNYFPK